MSVKFKNLKLRGWRQIKSLDIEFHPQLTIITGPNGAGKSTVIGISSMHFGYARNLLATPKKKRKSGIAGFSFGIFSWRNRKNKAEVPTNEIGEIIYTNEQRVPINVPAANAIGYNLSIPNQQPVHGIHIDSHRPPSVYQPIQNIPANMTSAQQMANGLDGFFKQFYSGGFTSLRQNSLHHIKNSIISMVIFGRGNEDMDPNPELIDLLKRFQEKLRIILPEDLGFEKVSVRMPDVILETKSGHFVIDAASGGIIKLIEITWQLFFQSEISPSFVVTMDEPENHLHPSMQRSFLGNLIQAFPEIQFIIASHSPFVVSSVRDSNVYALKYGEDEIELDEGVSDPQFVSGRRISSIKLDTINRAATASKILRDVLGVPTTIPDWANDRLVEIASEYKDHTVDQNMLDEMYSKLEQEGLIAEYPKAVSIITDQNS